MRSTRTWRRLERVARGLHGDQDVTIHVADGSPAGVMHRLAGELGAAAVVVGSTHRGAVGRVLIGDVAAGLLHGAPCPVLVAPRGYDAAGAQLHRIGVAYDGNPESDDALRERAQSTAERALESVPEGMLASSEVLHGRVVPALAGVSHELDLLVCGSRGYGALRSVAAGGVSRGLAHEAACPLLFVPRRPTATAASLWLRAATAERV